MYNKCSKCGLILRDKKKFKKCPNCMSRGYVEDQETPFSIKKINVSEELVFLDNELKKTEKYKLPLLLTSILIIPSVILMFKISTVTKMVGANINVFRMEKLKVTKEENEKMLELSNRVNSIKSFSVFSMIIMLIVVISLVFILK